MTPLTHTPLPRLLPTSTAPALGLSKAASSDRCSDVLKVSERVGGWVPGAGQEQEEEAGGVPEDFPRAVSLVWTRVQPRFQR